MNASADPQRSAGKTRLAQRRLAANMTQRQLADATGLSLRTIQALDRGEIPNPPIRYLTNCAAMLDCEILDLCEPDWLRFTDFKGGS